ncbi:MAG: hypothetical protein ABIG28_00820 [archaeon]
MGRVKSTMIKKAARQLHESVEELSNDFEYNKKLLKGTIHYKSVRNKVSGGVVKLVNKEKQKELKKNKEVKEIEDDRGTTEE